MLTLLKKNLKIKANSIQTYFRNIKRIARIVGHDEVPKSSKWLKGEDAKKLKKKLDDLPNNIARHLYLAAQIAFKMYENKTSEFWSKLVKSSADKYSEQREKLLKSAKENNNWGKGYSEVRKAATIFKNKVNHLLKKKKFENFSEQYEVQKFVILKLYANHAFRLSPATLKLINSEKENCLFRKKGQRKWIMRLIDHKTVKSAGTLEIELNANISKLISKYVTQRISKHDFFLSNKTGGKLSKSGLSKLLLRLTKQLVGKKIGSQLIRVMKVTENAEKITKAQQLQNEMGHSAKMQKTYVRI